MDETTGPSPDSSATSGLFGPLWKHLVPSKLIGYVPTIRNWLILAIVIRVALMPLTVSVDGESTAYVATVLTYKGQLLLSNDPPPVFYLTAGLLDLFRPLLSTSVVQVFTGSGVYTPANLPQGIAAASPGFSTFATIVKIPYLFFDLGIALLLLRLGPTERISMNAMKIWALNPFAIYVGFVVGQYDVIATFFVLFCVYFFLQQRYVASGVALGAATLFQIWPIIILPLLLIYLVRKDRNPQRWARPVTAYMVPVIVAVAALAVTYHFQAVFYQPANLALGGNQLDGYFGTVLYNRGAVSQPLVQGVETFLGYTVSFSTMSDLGDVIILAAAAYFAILLYLAYGPKASSAAVPTAVAIFLLVYFAFSLFLVQWFLWVQPFLVLLVATDLRRLLPLYLLLFVSYIMYSWFFGAPLWGQLVVVIHPVAVFWQPPMNVLTSWGLPFVLIVNLARTFLTVTCLFAAYLLCRRFRAQAGSPGSEAKPVNVA